MHHRLPERGGVEDVVAHRGEHLVRRVGQPLGGGRLLEERPDRPGRPRVDVDHPELVGQADRLPDRGHGAAGPGLDVGVEHLGEVHPVDVVGTHDDHDVGLLVAEEVERLVDGVRAAEEPVLADALLGGHGRHVVAQQCRHAPRGGDVAVQAVRLVLGEHDHLEVARVDDVREGEVDQAVDAPEGHRRLGAVGRQGHQPLALAAGEHDCEDVLARRRGGHATNLVSSGTAVDPPAPWGIRPLRLGPPPWKDPHHACRRALA